MKGNRCVRVCIWFFCSTAIFKTHTYTHSHINANVVVSFGGGQVGPLVFMLLTCQQCSKVIRQVMVTSSPPASACLFCVSMRMEIFFATVFVFKWCSKTEKLNQFARHAEVKARLKPEFFMPRRELSCNQRSGQNGGKESHQLGVERSDFFESHSSGAIKSRTVKGLSSTGSWATVKM